MGTPQHGDQVVGFRLGNEYLGISVLDVQEIIRRCDVTRVPRTPEYLMGVCNLRGSIVPVVDGRRRFGLPQSEDEEQNRVIVVETPQGPVGMLVDQVTEVFRLDEEFLEPSKDDTSHAGGYSLLAVARRGEQVVGLLDIKSALCLDMAA